MKLLIGALFFMIGPSAYSIKIDKGSKSQLSRLEGKLYSTLIKSTKTPSYCEQGFKKLHKQENWKKSQRDKKVIQTLSNPKTLTKATIRKIKNNPVFSDIYRGDKEASISDLSNSKQYCISAIELTLLLKLKDVTAYRVNSMIDENSPTTKGFIQACNDYVKGLQENIQHSTIGQISDCVELTQKSIYELEDLICNGDTPLACMGLTKYKKETSPEKANNK